MKLTYLGHSAFQIETNTNKKILIDPFLVQSPGYNPAGVTDIFVTHAHSDHLGTSVEIAGKTGAKIVGIFELANYCSRYRVNTFGVGLGAKIDYGWGKAAAVPAFHSSSFTDGTYGGSPCGFVFEIDGKTLYHAGDTSLSYEMKAIGEYYKPEIAILPVGGIYTMDIDAAVKAAEWLGASVVIPMHYNTFDKISVNIEDFGNKIAAAGKTPKIMRVGETAEF